MLFAGGGVSILEECVDFGDLADVFFAVVDVVGDRAGLRRGRGGGGLLGDVPEVFGEAPFAGAWGRLPAGWAEACGVPAEIGDDGGEALAVVAVGGGALGEGCLAVGEQIEQHGDGGALLGHLRLLRGVFRGCWSGLTSPRRRTHLRVGSRLPLS